MVSMSNALSVGSSAVGGAEKAHDLATTKGKFVSVGSKEFMSASVTDAAGQASSMAKKAPEVMVTIGSGGGKLAATAVMTTVKAALTATGAGAGVAAAIEAAETAVSKVANKAMEKMQAGMQEGNSVMKQGASTPSFSDPLKAMDQDKAQMKAPVEDLKAVASEVKDTAMAVGSAAKGAAGPGAEGPDAVGTQAFGDMQGRAGRDGDLMPDFATGPIQGKAGLASISDPISLEQGQTGDPIYMDPDSAKSPLRFVAQEGRAEVLDSFDSVLRGQAGGMVGDSDLGRPAAARVQEIRTGAEGAVRDAMDQVPAQEDFSAWDTARREAGGRALADEASKQGISPEEIKSRIVESEVSQSGGDKDRYQSYLRNALEDPSSNAYEKFYLGRGPEQIASIKAERAMGAASSMMKEGVLPGTPQGTARIEAAATAAARELGGKDVAGIRSDLLRQVDGRGESMAASAVSSVQSKIEALPGIDPQVKSAMQVRVSALTQAKLNSPEAGQGWQAMGDYLLTGGKGALVDSAMAKTLIDKAAKAASSGQGAN